MSQHVEHLPNGTLPKGDVKQERADLLVLDLPRGVLQRLEAEDVVVGLRRLDKVLQMLLHFDHTDARFGRRFEAFGFRTPLKERPRPLRCDELTLDGLIPLRTRLGEFREGQHPVEHGLADLLEKGDSEWFLSLALLHLLFP